MSCRRRRRRIPKPRVPARNTGRSFPWLLIVAGAIALPACTAPAADRSPRGATEITARTADSLVLTTPGGAQVWFTLARSATGAGGQACVERGLEIRGQGRKIPVPLLYTRVPPELVNDSTMRAILWTHCQPGDAYLVNLRSGQPVRDDGKQAS